VLRRSQGHLLHVVLMFQLAMGMYWPAAQALPMSPPPSDASAGHCPEHSAARAPQIHADRTAPAAGAHTGDLLKKHDCCRTPGCQCQGAFAAMSSEFTLEGSIAVSDGVTPLDPAPVADWRSDESLRPPIAERRPPA
jgi:hypothetical protein